MLVTLLFALSFNLLNVVYSGNNVQRGMRTTIDLLKLINNTKATVTLDSSALKQLIQMSSDSSSSPQRVNFSVNLESKPLTLEAGQTVKYNAVLTKDGNGYDDRMGVFTCPVAGTYMFIVNSLSTPGIWLHLKVNKKTVAKLHVSSSGYNRAPLIQLSRTVIIKLKSGDNIKVQNAKNNGYIYNDRIFRNSIVLTKK